MENKMRRILYSRIILITFFIAGISNTLHAAFEYKESGARAAALAGAYTAVADDAEAVWWNPAGLRFCRNIQANTLYSNLYNMEDLKYVNFSMAVPTLVLGTWGIGYSDFGTAAYMEKDVRFSFATGLTEGIYFGTSLKSNRVKIGNDGGSASAFGLDLGVMANVNVRMALSVININNPLLGDTSEAIARRFMCGLMVKPYKKITASIDLHKPVEQDLEPRIGLECELNKTLTLRAGTQARPSRFSFGFGFNWSIFSLNYAFMTHTVLSTQHLFGLKCRFGEVEPERKDAAASEKELAPVSVSGKRSRRIVNINVANVRQLSKLPGIGTLFAKKIIEYREKSGRFKSPRELMNIYGFTRKKFDKVKDFVTVHAIIGIRKPVGSSRPSAPKAISEIEKKSETEIEIKEEADKESLENFNSESQEVEEIKSEEIKPEAVEYEEYDMEERPEEEFIPEVKPVPVQQKKPEIKKTIQRKSKKVKRTNINKANIKELDMIPGISYSLARNIVRYRNARGRFRSWQELKRVPGISERILQNIKEAGILE
jgi:competence ComEA-like helix-hairpin-helix protein